MDYKKINLRNKFQKDGFVIFRDFFSDSDLNELTKISLEMVNKSEKNEWKHVRIYRDYPNFFNKLNIFGIDFPLNKKIHHNSFDEFQKLDYKDFILDFLNWKNFYSPLIRLHTNSSFYNYQGEWHRDDKNYPSPNSIQIIIYLLDEKGYRIVPKYNNDLLKNYNISTTGHRTENRGFANLPENIYETINVNRGDILLHESALLHQGFCKRRRLHYHIRHIRKDDLLNKKNNKLNFEEKFLKDFDLSNLEGVMEYDISKSPFKLKMKRLKSFILYFFPRFKSVLNNLTRNNKQSIFHSTNGQ